eukprot:3828611-Rhodomonas_salina.1
MVGHAVTVILRLIGIRCGLRTAGFKLIVNWNLTDRGSSDDKACRGIGLSSCQCKGPGVIAGCECY